MVYLIGSYGLPFVKVGYTASKSSSNRLKSIQTSSPMKVFTICEVDGGRNDERVIHRKLSDHVAPAGNEWFWLTDDSASVLSSFFDIDVLEEAAKTREFNNTKDPMDGWTISFDGGEISEEYAIAALSDWLMAQLKVKLELEGLEVGSVGAARWIEEQNKKNRESTNG